MLDKRQKLFQWAENESLEHQDLTQAIELTESDPNLSQWLIFLKTFLLWTAVISICIGVIFFFAYNWIEMGRFIKFALVELTMIAAIVFFLKIAKTELIITASLMAKSLLTGALLALVGQTYQTGADPWQLFVIWSILIMPWVIISRSNILWSFWVVIINLGFALFLEVADSFFNVHLTEQSQLWAIALFNIALLYFFEFIYNLNRARLYFPAINSQLSVNNKTSSNSRITCRLLVFIVGLSITMLTIVAIFDNDSKIYELLFYTLWMAFVYLIYRWKIPDLFLLSAASLSFIIIVTCLLLEFLMDGIVDGGFLLISLGIIILSSFAGIWLKKIAKEFQQQSIEGE